MSIFENFKPSENPEFMEFKEDMDKLKNEIEANALERNFGGLSLKKNGTYEVPGISGTAKALRDKQFPEVIFGNCRLSRKLGSVLYPDSLIIPVNGAPKRETHKETFYSQRVLQGGALEIPGRHVAEDGTIRDKDGYIVVAAPLKVYPKGTKIMTTLGPGKVYDTGFMKGKWIDIYVDW